MNYLGGEMRVSADDGCASDIRLAGLCEKYDIKCTFYWPVEWHSMAYSKGYQPLSYDDAKRIADRFEIGSHTITHRFLTSLSSDEAYYEIKESKNMLEELFYTKITKFCPPRGYTNELLTKFTMTFYKSQRLTKGRGLVHVHPNSGANDNKPWRESITDETQELWMHTHELDRFNMWGELEEVLSENSHS